MTVAKAANHFARALVVQNPNSEGFPEHISEARIASENCQNV